ncbi:MAG: DUF11 domain-containing protein, partial [Chloroflexi bacterium]|nr:DUF11 domain-containing protein [Chloroflexota bacterium]
MDEPYDPADGIHPLQLYLRADSEWVGPGEVIQLTATVVNSGAEALQGLVVTAPLPPGVAFEPGSGAGFGLQEGGRSLTWAVPEVEIGGKASGSFGLRVADLAVGDMLGVTVTAQGGGLPDPQSATADIRIVEPRSDTAWLTPSGGWFRSLDGRIAIQVPPGAVEGQTRFVYSPVSDLADLPPLPATMQAAFNLEAYDGAGRAIHQFPVPLKLVYTFPPDERSTPVFDEHILYTFDEGRQEWVELGRQTDPQGGRLALDLSHFSVFSDGTYSYILEQTASIRGAQAQLFSGSIAYQYGFSLPPGRGGLAPKLGLSYTSSMHTPNAGHLSQAGFGWQIAGADYLFIPPGDANSVKRTVTLQGVAYSLRKTNEATETWFAKENPFIKVVKVDDGAYHVWTPNGVKYVFGGSSQVHYWKLCGAGDQHKRYVRLPLTSMQAPNGNTVTYTW